VAPVEPACRHATVWRGGDGAQDAGDDRVGWEDTCPGPTWAASPASDTDTA